MSEKLTMICGDCGEKIAISSEGVQFDTMNTGWECPFCHKYWMSSDGWKRLNNVIVAHGLGITFERKEKF